jgi:hypothetical protein
LPSGFGPTGNGRPISRDNLRSFLIICVSKKLVYSRPSSRYKLTPFNCLMGRGVWMINRMTKSFRRAAYIVVLAGAAAFSSTAGEAASEKDKALAQEAVQSDERCHSPDPKMSDAEILKSYNICVEAFRKWDALHQSSDATLHRSADVGIILVSDRISLNAALLAERRLNVGDKKDALDYLKIACATLDTAMPIKLSNETPQQRKQRETLTTFQSRLNAFGRKNFGRDCKSL